MQNPLGIYYAFLCTNDTVDWVGCLRRAQAAGLTILEVSAPRLRALTAQARWEIADRAARLGLQLTFATALTPETDVSSESAAVRAAGVRQLVADVLMVRAMGGLSLGGILTGVGKHFPPGIETGRNAAVGRAAKALAEAAKAAEDQSINLCLEVVNRFESPLVNTCEEGLRVINAVDSPRLGVHLDTFHMNIEEADLGRAIRLAGKHLIHFHACENNRALPGQGHINWVEVFAALSAVGYTGPIVMESMPGPFGSFAARLNIWRKLAGNVDQELAAATRFLQKRREDAYAV